MSGRLRNKNNGFIGVDLAANGDMSLYNRVQEEKKTKMISQSAIIRIALIEYFNRQDSEG